MAKLFIFFDIGVDIPSTLHCAKMSILKHPELKGKKDKTKH